MVQLYYVAVLYKHSSKPTILSYTCDLSGWGFFQKSSVKEFMSFSSQMLVNRTDPDVMVSVTEKTYVCHAFVRTDNLAATAVTDDEYPKRVAHTLLKELLNDFSTKIPEETWSNDSVKYIAIKEFLSKYKDPKNGDRLAAIQSELDETQIILHNTIEAVLKRGENLDELITKAEELSIHSKTFYKNARKTNSCCTAL